jgi:hypothetical protein
MKFDNIDMDETTYLGAFQLVFMASFYEFCEEDPINAMWYTNCISGYTEYDTLNKDNKDEIIELLIEIRDSKGHYTEIMYKWFMKEQHYASSDENENEKNSKIDLCMLIKSQPKVIELMNDPLFHNQR